MKKSSLQCHKRNISSAEHKRLEQDCRHCRRSSVLLSCVYFTFKVFSLDRKFGCLTMAPEADTSLIQQVDLPYRLLALLAYQTPTAEQLEQWEAYLVSTGMPIPEQKNKLKTGAGSNRLHEFLEWRSTMLADIHGTKKTTLCSEKF